MSGNQKILYIDDEALLKMAFVETLKQQGFDARGAISGEEALELIDQDVPDIIILDIMMKPMDGWETLTRIKAQERSKDVPVIMQTGKSLTIRDVLRYGSLIEDYLIKPVRLPELLKAIDQVNTRRRCIEGEIGAARDLGGDPRIIEDYAVCYKKLILNERLTEILGRIYPIKPDGTLETDLDIPELHLVVERFAADRKRYQDLKSSLFGS